MLQSFIYIRSSNYGLPVPFVPCHLLENNYSTESDASTGSRKKYYFYENFIWDLGGTVSKHRVWVLIDILRYPHGCNFVNNIWWGKLAHGLESGRRLV